MIGSVIITQSASSSSPRYDASQAHLLHVRRQRGQHARHPLERRRHIEPGGPSKPDSQLIALAMLGLERLARCMDTGSSGVKGTGFVDDTTVENADKKESC